MHCTQPLIRLAGFRASGNLSCRIAALVNFVAINACSFRCFMQRCPWTQTVRTAVDIHMNRRNLNNHATRQTPTLNTRVAPTCELNAMDIAAFGIQTIDINRRSPLGTFERRVPAA